MNLSFEKWHGCRNDFILIRITDDMIFRSLVNQAGSLCTRAGDGIGADGILVLHFDKKGDHLPARFSVINSDGSIAATCGNGIRCAASSILQEWRESVGRVPDEIQAGIEIPLTLGGSVNCRFMGDPPAGFPLVAVDMGIPANNAANTIHAKARDEVSRVAGELGLEQLTGRWGSCEISNQHLVFFLEETDQELLQQVGKAFQQSRAWDGINVHLAVEKEPDSRDQATARKEIGHEIGALYDVLPWERGAGATAACGSGACAVASLALEDGFTDRSEWIGIQMPGGRLYIRHDQPDESVIMAGPARRVFTGNVEL